MIKRKDFKKIITIRSAWSPNKNLGDRRLPNGELFSEYLYRLVFSQMELDKLGIGKDGNLFYFNNDEKELYRYPCGCNYTEDTFVTQQKKRIKQMVEEIIAEE